MMRIFLRYEDARNIIKKLCKVTQREGYSLSVREIESLTDINRGIIQNLTAAQAYYT